MPTIVIAVLIIGGAVLYAAAGVFLVRKFLRPHVGEGHNDVLVPMFLTAGTLYAVLLGFLVVIVWEGFDVAKNTSADEASTLATLYRQTGGMPLAEQRELRGYLRDYAEAVINEEWKIQAASGGASAKARREIANIYRSFAGTAVERNNSAINREFLRTYSTVAADRNRRTLQANESLPWIIWFGVIFGGMIVVGMTFFLYMDNAWPHMVVSGVMAALVGTLLFMMVALDRPYSGPMAIDPGPFEHSLAVYKAVDAGN